MKLLIAAVVAAIIGGMLWYGTLMASDIRTCAEHREDRIIEARLRAATTGEIRKFCELSYVQLSEWNACIEESQIRRVPPVAARFLRPYVMVLLRFIGDKGPVMETMKIEHDERCTENVDLMFYPPEQY